MSSSSQITSLLIKWSDGDNDALNDVYPLIERELRQIASRHIFNLRPGDTMQTTAVIDEAYLRLNGQRHIVWKNRSHFFAIASHMMRRVILNHIRDRNRQKRGGAVIHISLPDNLFAENRHVEFLELEEVLDRLDAIEPRQCRVVEMKFFGGYTSEEIAKALDRSVITIDRDWKFAKTWLEKELSK